MVCFEESTFLDQQGRIVMAEELVLPMFFWNVGISTFNSNPKTGKNNEEQEKKTKKENCGIKNWTRDLNQKERKKFEEMQLK